MAAKDLPADGGHGQQVFIRPPAQRERRPFEGPSHSTRYRYTPGEHEGQSGLYPLGRRKRHQITDALTKRNGCADHLRGILQKGEFVVVEENRALQLREQERATRVTRRGPFGKLRPESNQRDDRASCMLCTQDLPCVLTSRILGRADLSQHDHVPRTGTQMPDTRTYL